MITQDFGPGISGGYPSGGTGNINVDFSYSVVDTDPGAGESISFTSTVDAEATDPNGGEPTSNDPTYANAQNNLSYGFTENVSD